MRNLVSVFVLWIEYQLHNPVGIPQVDEDKAAVVTAAMNPSRKSDGLASVFGAQVAAVSVLQHQSRVPGKSDAN